MQHAVEVILQLRLPDTADTVDIGCIPPGDHAAVVGCLGLHTDDEVHPAHIGHHHLRQLHAAQVGQAQAGLTLAHRVKHGLHGDILDEQRHDPQHGRTFAGHIGGKLGPHSPAVVLQPHLVVDQRTQLLKTARPQPRIDLRGDIGRKVPQRFAGKQLSQIYRQQHLHRLAVAGIGHLLRLQVQNSLHHGGAQQLRHGHAVVFGAGTQLICRHHQRHQVLVAICLRRAGQVPGRGLGAAAGHISSIPGKAVLQLLRRRLL